MQVGHRVWYGAEDARYFAMHMPPSEQQSISWGELWGCCMHWPVGAKKNNWSFYWIWSIFDKRIMEWSEKWSGHGGSLKRSARAVRAQCNYLGVWPY